MTTNSHIIPLSQATQMTHAYQNAPQYQGSTISGLIAANAYQLLLAQPGCVGVRTYFALEQGVLTFVVVGVDNNGNDMANGVILDGVLGCPPNCPTNSPLM